MNTISHYYRRLKRIWAYMEFIEEQRMKAALWTGSVGPLM